MNFEFGFQIAQSLYENKQKKNYILSTTNTMFLRQSIQVEKSPFWVFKHYEEYLMRYFGVLGCIVDFFQKQR